MTKTTKKTGINATDAAAEITNGIYRKKHTEPIVLKNRDRDDLLADIARVILNRETLETRYRDSLDFQEASAAGIKAALEIAYEAGKMAAGDEAARERLKRD